MVIETEERQMTPYQAAARYFALEARDPRAAMAFAMDYEDGASEDEFNRYLDALARLSCPNA
jgi:hypothetical protein